MSKSITNHELVQVDEVVAGVVCAGVHRSRGVCIVTDSQSTSYTLQVPLNGSARVRILLIITGAGEGAVKFNQPEGPLTGFLATFDTGATNSKNFTDIIAPNVSAGTSCGLTFDVIGGFLSGSLVCIDAAEGSHYTGFSCRALEDVFQIQVTAGLVLSTKFYNVEYYD